MIHLPSNPVLSFSSFPLSLVTLQISSSALHSPFALPHGVDSELSLPPVAPTPLCLRVLAALIRSWFHLRKDEFWGQLSHTTPSEDGLAGSKKTLPSLCHSRVESACHRQSFGKCQMLIIKRSLSTPTILRFCDSIKYMWSEVVWSHNVAVVRTAKDTSNGSKAFAPRMGGCRDYFTFVFYILVLHY